jgi:hypothetical protein
VPHRPQAVAVVGQPVGRRTFANLR